MHPNANPEELRRFSEPVRAAFGQLDRRSIEHWLADLPSLTERMVWALRIEPETLPPVFEFVVDNDAKLEDKIVKPRHRWVSPSFTSENFPAISSGKKRVKARFLDIDSEMTTEEVFILADRKGSRHASATEWMDFEAKFGDELSMSGIAALGIGHEVGGMTLEDIGDSLVPVFEESHLSTNLGGVQEKQVSRIITLQSCATKWARGSRFLVIESEVPA